MTDVLKNFFSNYEKEKVNRLYAHNIFLLENNILSFSPKPVKIYKTLSNDRKYHSSTNYNYLPKTLTIIKGSSSVTGKSTNTKRSLSNITPIIYDSSTYHIPNQKKYFIDKNNLNAEIFKKKFNLIDFSKKGKYINNEEEYFKNKMAKKCDRDNSKKCCSEIFKNKQNKIGKLVQNLIKNEKYQKFKINKDENFLKTENNNELKIINNSKESVKLKFLKDVNNPKSFLSQEKQKKILLGNEKYRSTILNRINEYNFIKNKHKTLKKPACFQKKTLAIHKEILGTLLGKEKIKNIKTEKIKSRNFYYPRTEKKGALTFDEKMDLFMKRAKNAFNYFSDISTSYHRMKNEMKKKMLEKNDNDEDIFEYLK